MGEIRVKNYVGISSIMAILILNCLPNLADAKPLKYGPEMKSQWRKTLDEVIVPLDDELK